jgi:cytochrome c oxidase assembly protein subunit 11
MTAYHFDTMARRNQRTGLVIFTVVLGMIALSFASVPMYRMFCSATGWGGAAQNLAVAPPPSAVRDRIVEVFFNADVDQNLPWEFKPERNRERVQIGQEGLIAFVAHNETDKIITGTAVYNVTPPKAGAYFHKTQCFCFGEQTLKPGEKVQMPVMFYLDPSFADDPNMKDVTAITLSYTFYKADSPALDRAIAAYNGVKP